MNMFRAFMELDEAFSDRQAMIDDIKRAGKSYKFDRFTDAQIFRIWQRLQKPVDAISKPKHELDLDFDDKTIEYCDCGTRLSDAGFCPICYDGEERLYESVYDMKYFKLDEWVTAPNQQTQNSTNTSVVQNTITSGSNNKYVVTIVLHGGRLRALATDGVNPAAWVAFPNDLRTVEGQQYEVDRLIWNGKNYRVSGNIKKI